MAILSNASFWRRPRVIASAVLLVLVALLLASRLRGPQLPGYRLEAGPLVQVVVATGRVISTSRVQVGSEVTGTVIERRVKEGDVVKPGDVLLVLRADDLEARVRQAEAALRELQASTRPQSSASLRQAEAQLAQASRERQRRADLFARQLVSREILEQAEEAEAVARAVADKARLAADAASPGSTAEIQLREQVAAARAQRAKAVIRAGIAGIVLTRNAEPGDLVQPGRVLFEIARGGDTEIEVPVDEKNLAALAVGQVAQCIADAWPDRPFRGVVNYIAPGVDAARGTVTIRLRVDPPPDYLRQDMTVSVNVETGRRERALAVPNDALLLEADGTRAVLAVRDGHLQRVPVRLGLAGLAMSEVLEGVASGDQVLSGAAGVTGVAAGDRVRVGLEALPAAGVDATRRELPVNFD
ncbi:MAG: efflux RND transporter periplasmic adaptor subunit [Proteobacteria bacterium]|jgi:HlyD family secretion protein|nr:efflux RND transporter periplasmic adaptor subunit [Pseudomonadota bacterium]MBK9252356.1 efflux RND transporter periplasmic adaptor subunit [Pseudomonadota bacterium]